MGKVTFDGDARKIYVNPGINQLDIQVDVYSEWVDWRAIPGNSVYPEAMRYLGHEPIPDGFTPTYFFLINGWKLILSVNPTGVAGTLFSEDYPTPYYDENGLPVTMFVVYDRTLPTVQNIRIEMDTNSVKLQEIKAGITNVPAAVRTELSAELAHLMTLENNPGLTPGQATMLLELYALAGLDPTKPLIVTKTSRTAGATINQAIAGDNTFTNVTRI